FEEVLDNLNQRQRKLSGKKADPSVGIIDSQSVKIAHTCAQDVAYDAGKRIKGRKRHIVTDTLAAARNFLFPVMAFEQIPYVIIRYFPSYL
ncbi:hypothetical protein EZS27_044208, partial [termite gut metagenome]